MVLKCIAGYIEDFLGSSFLDRFLRFLAKAPSTVWQSIPVTVRSKLARDMDVTRQFYANHVPKTIRKVAAHVAYTGAKHLSSIFKVLKEEIRNQQARKNLREGLAKT